MLRGFIVTFCLAPMLVGASPEFDRGLKLYLHTDYEGSLKLLKTLPKQGEVFELMGKNYFMLGDFKKASEAFEKAVAADPSNSVYEHWLGKAYGRRAETSSPFTAPGFASKTRQHFEKSIALDPRNKEAIDDLFEYYLQAPGFLGGGVEKAAALAERVAALDPIQGLSEQARLAERRKEYATAEDHLRRAAELAPMQVGRFIDLAKFLAKRGRADESEKFFREAERRAPNDPQLLFQRAETYIRTGRNIDTARELLKRYLDAKLSPDDPSRLEAERLLKQAGG